MAIACRRVVREDGAGGEEGGRRQRDDGRETDE
jgi:hypothetical protein